MNFMDTMGEEDIRIENKRSMRKRLLKKIIRINELLRNFFDRLLCFLYSGDTNLEENL